MPTYTTPSGTRYELFADMLSQPHLLIAGATGSGKSVALNGIICTALLRFPSEYQFLLIDLKRVELSPYRDLPHTLGYADDGAGAADLLRRALSIAGARYQDMQRRGLRRWDGAEIYVVIDEFADLMTTDARTVKPLIQRIAQIGRAAGIHLLVGTQTPIAKVLPTEIKCNFDARLGLRTRSAQDSRNILGYSGLETLPRYGQGVYMTPAGDELYNIPYISDDEQRRLIDWWLTQKQQQRRRSFRDRLRSALRG